MAIAGQILIGYDKIGGRAGMWLVENVSSLLTRIDSDDDFNSYNINAGYYSLKCLLWCS